LTRTLIAIALFGTSAAAFAGLDNANGEALHLHKKTVRSVEVVTVIEGQAGAETSAFGSTMKRWVDDALKQNGFVVDATAKGAPDLRFGGYCGRAVSGCTLKLHVARDLWYAHPDGAVFKLPARDVAEEKVSKEVSSYSQDEMYGLFAEMLTRFVTVANQTNPIPVTAPN
jgi:hypothetical protein